jgi:hypothetical protein
VFSDGVTVAVGCRQTRGRYSSGGGEHHGSRLTVDFLGFGLSDKPRRHRYSLLEQADIVQQLVAEAAASLVVLVADQLKKLFTAVASSGDVEVAKFK